MCKFSIRVNPYAPVTPFLCLLVSHLKKSTSYLILHYLSYQDIYFQSSKHLYIRSNTLPTSPIAYLHAMYTSRLLYSHYKFPFTHCTNVANAVFPPHIGAAGRELVSYRVDRVLAESNADAIAAFYKRVLAMQRPALQVNGLPSVAEDPTAMTPISQSFAKQPTDRESLKLNMLRKIRPPPFKYAWTFYHDKHSTTSDYEGRLTLLLENITTVKPFWESFNRFPLENLEMKDSVHFFRRGVKPAWEDRRNVKGGCWTFRVGKSNSKEFWKEILLLAVGEQFSDVIQPGKRMFALLLCSYCITDAILGDDLCGLSYSVRFNSVLIMIWNRDGSNQKSINGIRDVVLNKITPELKPKDSAIFYKKHSEHAGFDEAVAKAKAVKDAEQIDAGEDGAKIVEAEVTKDEGDKALLEEAEGDMAVEAEVEKRTGDETSKDAGAEGMVA